MITKAFHKTTHTSYVHSTSSYHMFGEFLILSSCYLFSLSLYCNCFFSVPSIKQFTYLNPIFFFDYIICFFLAYFALFISVYFFFSYLLLFSLILYSIFMFITINTECTFNVTFCHNLFFIFKFSVRSVLLGSSLLWCAEYIVLYGWTPLFQQVSLNSSINSAAPVGWY
jgi:hypothetical protein